MISMLIKDQKPSNTRKGLVKKDISFILLAIICSLLVFGGAFYFLLLSFAKVF